MSPQLPGEVMARVGVVIKPVARHCNCIEELIIEDTDRDIKSLSIVLKL